jgi:hypothetical protein
MMTSCFYISVIMAELGVVSPEIFDLYPKMVQSKSMFLSFVVQIAEVNEFIVKLNRKHERTTQHQHETIDILNFCIDELVS